MAFSPSHWVERVLGCLCCVDVELERKQRRFHVLVHELCTLYDRRAALLDQSERTPEEEMMVRDLNTRIEAVGNESNDLREWLEKKGAFGTR